MKSMNSLMNFRTLVYTLAVTAVLGACKKEYDAPPVRTIPQGQILTVAELRALFTGTPKHFGGDTSIYAVVTADEVNGNLYKNVYIQDHTGALIMRLLSSGGLYQGDSIRIYLPGTVLGSYAGMLQLDSVDVDNNVVKQSTLVHVEPQEVTMSQITPAMQGKLIRLNNVQFVEGDTGRTYANAITQATENRTLEDCNNGTVLVRNSGYSNFAGLPIPNGKGSFTAVVGQFNSDMQLFIRNINEVQLNGPRCGQNECLPIAELDEDFSLAQNNQNIMLECWINVFTEGTRLWKGIVAGSESFCEARPASFDVTTTSWFVSAPVQYSAGMQASFRSAIGNTWQHDGLSVWVSTDIDLVDGTGVANAPWVQLTEAALAGSGSPVGTWFPSGNIPLSNYLNDGDNFVIGFKYTGVPNTQATSYRIDDVLVQ
ncbi:MAG TPA: DUF5689 domain-containing protein [Flavobacteriales bacterium]|jgi:hypothetical protein|nr:DUF5017 domain-containing protein [Flavobacteriales bacterium]MBK6549970.1 DUF5017 domain-containing protein [Flavobacteriales bacterium]MBK7102480.1 DUF5017 domain-containing protein [Flavobacteriales bacterium]MBK7113215.1 DUF5017 domain-containing protein [Flavobacteriales bacterium]MBK7482785.1 DUF5017 domain-containing protein [Flavobacteriales bacterium]